MSPEQIQQWAVKAKLWKMTHFAHTTPEEWETLATFARLVEQHVRADEREACAKVCDVEAEYWRDLLAMGCAEASDICATEIRSRKS